MKKFVIYLLLLLLLTAQKIYAQKEFYNWYFGINSAISFLSGAPVSLNNSQTTYGEGSASISDKNGNLLFYTQGVNVYNKAHLIMSNGSGLTGHLSSTQVQIVPQPGNDSIYYVFTVDAAENHLVNGLRYSVINMNLDYGNGRVIFKNAILLAPATEKIAIALHANETDFWIVGHGWGDNKYYSFLLSSSGLNSNPVISSIGNIHIGGSAGSPAAMNYTNAVGYLKFSPSFNKLACAIHDAGILQLFEFNRTSGEVTSLLATATGYRDIYGVEFSQNENFLYASKIYSTSCLYQFNIQDGSLNDVIRIANPLNDEVNALQIGPDGKIYVGTYSDYLGVIQNPDNAGVSCNYVPNGVYLGTGIGYRGLPLYLPSPKITIDFTLGNGCYDDLQNFSVISSVDPDSVLWNFGDPASGALNNSSDTLGVHQYPFPGVFDVELTVFGLGSQSKITKRINVQSISSINLGKDTILCEDDEITLDVSEYSGTCQWYDGSTLPVKTINQPGEYYVRVTNSCGTARDTISVNYSIIPKLLNISDTTVCRGDVIEFQAVEQNGIIYNWSTGEHTSRISFIPLENEIISLQVINEYECSDVYDFSLNTINCYKEIEIPNVFTPNQDNINDFWIIKNIDFYAKAEILIFNRWGMELFKSKGYETPWDGTFYGKLLPTGCYYYIIILNNGTPAYTGHVSIYR